jgi:hypothetical protein
MDKESEERFFYHGIFEIEEMDLGKTMQLLLN